MRVEAARIGKDPGVAAAEKFLLKADSRVFVARHDAVRADADEGDHRGSPEFDFRFKAPPAGTKFVVAQFIGAGGRALDNIGDAEVKVQKQGIFKR